MTTLVFVLLGALAGGYLGYIVVRGLCKYAGWDLRQYHDPYSITIFLSTLACAIAMGAIIAGIDSNWGHATAGISLAATILGFPAISFALIFSGYLIKRIASRTANFFSGMAIKASDAISDFLWRIWPNGNRPK